MIQIPASSSGFFRLFLFSAYTSEDNLFQVQINEDNVLVQQTGPYALFPVILPSRHAELDSASPIDCGSRPQ